MERIRCSNLQPKRRDQSYLFCFNDVAGSVSFGQAIRAQAGILIWFEPNFHFGIRRVFGRSDSERVTGKRTLYFVAPLRHYFCRI